MKRTIVMQTKKVPLASLPLPPRTRRLTQNLTPDPIAKTPSDFLKLVQETPSLQRRARLLDSSAHFSYVNPLPVPFPFRIDFPEEIQDKREFIEAWLSHREATELSGKAMPLEPEEGGIALQKYTSQERVQERELLGVCSKCVEDCLPQLDIGDALEHIGDPSLTLTASKANEANSTVEGEVNQAEKARQELLDVLSGHTVLASFPSVTGSPEGYAPWSIRYSGHQFGQWAGQLGDGRAISILEVPHPQSPTGLYELQLKGAGRTPFSRSADGLAVVRSSIREYLCAEAVFALGVPTTRSLALTYLPTLPVIRERQERAAVVTRVASTFLRIGSFQALNPPESMFFLGGGQQEADLEALRILGEYVSEHVLRLEVKKGEPWAEKLVMECAKRNAQMVAGWQAYGFMHGVINTDNVSIAGLTIDYGPYAWMDLYDPTHICNHSDDSGRYSFKMQPTMIVFALRGFLAALAPIIGAERSKQSAVIPGWSEDLPENQLAEWTKVGMSLQGDMERLIMDEVQTVYNRLMRRRLGLQSQLEEDHKELVSPLLEILERRQLDFPATLRLLAQFQPNLLSAEKAEDLKKLFDKIDTSSRCSKPTATDQDPTRVELTRWLHRFAQRIEKEMPAPVDQQVWHAERQKRALGANPRFVLRQWILEEVIAKVENDPISGRRVLAKVLEMASNPFKDWGAEFSNLPEEELDKETREERRLCTLGDEAMLGFQCSCSS